MLQSAFGRKFTSSTRSLPRRFHTSTQRNALRTFEADIQDIASRCYECHTIFQYVHEHTALPWVVSIPLATILIRSLVTPFRYYFALRRRDQRLATPQLILAAKLIEKQKELRLDGSREAPEEIGKWVEKQWKRRRDAIDVEFPRARPSMLVSTSTNFDAANIGAMAIVFTNTQTLLALNFGHPDLFQIDSIDHLSTPLSVLFACLAIYNTMSYHGVGLSALAYRSNRLTVSDFNVFSWTESEAKLLAIVALPLLASVHLAFSPAAVLISVLSNSVYTLFETKLVNGLAKVPGAFDNQRRSALQSTRRSRRGK